MKMFRQRRGTVTVEMAIAAPILFLFVFAALEAASMNVVRHSVDNAAYEGARRGIVPGATANDVRVAATAIMTAAGARNINVDVNPAVIDDETEELIVTVTAPVAGNRWTWSKFFANGDNIVGTCRMLREQW